MKALPFELQVGAFGKHWKKTAVKHLALFQSGSAIDGEAISETGEFPVFGGNGMRGFASHFTHEGCSVLIGRQGALCGNVNYAKGKFWASEHALVGRPRREFEVKWLGETLRSANLGQYSTAAAQPGIAADTVNNLRIPVPPYEEQTAIANFLDRETARIDGLVEKKGRFIELLKEKRAAVITHAVTKGIDADVPMKDSGVEWIGQVPSHWDVSRIAALFREAFRAPDPNLPVLSVSIHDGVTDGELSDEERDRKVALSEDRTKYQGVAPGDLVYNMMRAWQGAFGAVQVYGLVSPAYVVAQPIAEFRTKFIEHILHTKSASEEIRRFSRGIADFRMRLYWDHFRNLRVCLPSLGEQDEILAYIDRETARIDALISTTNRSIELLKEKRSALITAAVTGKTDARSAA
ncbi:restriction endonuclease subunit S [Celeribacter halophilus]|uniref:restriction endonuclease subunit S n=1 Tax=Celeribacter halophilus TaxID=576117 RepID=UPI003A8DEA46